MVDKSEEEIIDEIIFWREKGDHWAEARYLGLLGVKYKEQRKFQKAVETWEKELQLKLSLGDADGAAGTLFAIADTYWAKPYYPYPGLGDIHRAIAYAERAIALTSNKRDKAMYLRNLASWYAMIGNLQRAIECSDLSASYDERYDNREERMKFLKEWVAKGYI